MALHGLKQETIDRCAIAKFADCQKYYLFASPRCLNSFDNLPLSALPTFSVYVKILDNIVEYMQPVEYKQQYVDEMRRATRKGENYHIMIKKSDVAQFQAFMASDRARREKSLRDSLNPDLMKIANNYFNLIQINGDVVKYGPSYDNVQRLRGVIKSILDNLVDGQSIIRFILAVYDNDPGLIDHAAAVTLMSLWYGKFALKMANISLTEFVVCAALHDVGKNKISLDILDKASSLTAKESSEFRNHTIYGRNMLEMLFINCPNVPLEAAYVAIQHHEKFNGTGYPFCRSGTEEKNGKAGICKAARAVAIIDMFVNLISKRPMKDHLTPSEAVTKIKDESGVAFDPEYVTLFLNEIYQSVQQFRAEKKREQQDAVQKKLQQSKVIKTVKFRSIVK